MHKAGKAESPTKQVRREELAERAAALFRDGKSYREISVIMNLTKAQAKSKVHAGLGMSPALARQLKEPPHA